MPAEPTRRPAPISRDLAAGVARAFHESYEKLAPQHGYETREASRTDWSSVPEQNRNLMIATVYDLLDQGEMVAFDVDEAHALSEWMAETELRERYLRTHPLNLDPDDSRKDPLLTAFAKVLFASGRHFGLTNFDMGMEDA